MSDALRRVLPGCPEPPALGVDWRAVEAGNPWLGRLAGCPQDPIHHPEGDVLVHTRAVVEALVSLPAWRALSADDQRLLFGAALLHDLGKPERTVEKPDGRIGARGHARRGAARARELLLEAAGGEELAVEDWRARERLVALVRWHGLPLALVERGDPVREVLAASLVVRCDLLALLAEADVLGRASADRQELLARVALFREQARELGCLDRPYAFPDDHTRFCYFQRAAPGAPPPSSPLHDDTRLEVTLMSGLPGAGKDHWLAAHHPELPVVSLDAVRRQLGRRPSGRQAAVLHRARDEARGHLRAGRSFAWSATNLSRELRARVVALCAGYRARIRVVYVEAPWRVLLQRNHRRQEGAVPERALRELLLKLELPDPGEAHAVEAWVGDGRA